jgi:BirA family biotin operon repressor/biotin-[acetyl-CoA-carboxylase] ligase
MLEEFAEHFRSWQTRWQMEGFAPVRAAWLAAAAMSRGEPIRVRLEAASLDGCFLDIDAEGALLLEAAGERRHVSAGDVFPVNR